MQSCREQGLPEPKIEIVPNFVNLIIWFNDQLSAQDSPQVTPQVQAGNQQPDIAAVQEKIISFCRIPRSLSEISEMLGIKDRKWIKDKYMKPLIGSRLTYTLPESPSSRYQKYQAIREEH